MKSENTELRQMAVEEYYNSLIINETWTWTSTWTHCTTFQVDREV